MKNMTKGQIEAKISEALIKFEKEFMGRGPRETVSYIIKDVIFIRLKGVFTPAEEQLAKTSEGAKLIKETRVELLESGVALLGKIVFDVTGCEVTSMHSDICTKTGEKIIVFVLDRDFEKKFI
ncbi:MAG: DUF2294 family protein [Candidatus Scalindua sp.]|nr:DUF2294 family protein [Candidatus Scalindua sp.]